MSYDEKASLWIKHAKANGSFYKYLERPAMLSLLPKNLKDKKILCLGVGSGQEIDMYKHLGATDITGFDNSPKLLKVAKNRYPNHGFELIDLNNLKSTNQTYDVIGSSMAMHYVLDWGVLLDFVFDSLNGGGEFVFSTHNPVWWSAEKVDLPDGYAWVVGVKTNTKNHSSKVLGSYLKVGPMKAEIIKGMEVEFINRPFSAMLNAILSSKLKLEAVIEPMPIEVAKTEDPKFYATASRLSQIVVFRLTKPASLR